MMEPELTCQKRSLIRQWLLRAERGPFWSSQLLGLPLSNDQALTLSFLGCGKDKWPLGVKEQNLNKMRVLTALLAPSSL
jgi:hypothetical protein